MKMKKIAAFMLAAATAFSMVGCGSSSSSSTDTSEATATEDASSDTSTDDASAEESTDESSDSSSSAARSIDEIKSSGKVIMATNAEFEPFEYKDGNDIVGIDPEIAQKIADKLGVELEITDIAFDSCIPAINSGKADFVAAGMTATDERRKNVDFSDPYFDASQAIIVPVDSDIKSRTDLNGKKIGVQTGTTGDTYVTNEDGSGDITAGEVSRYSKGMDAVSDLMNGRIDAVVIDNFPAQKLVAKNSDKIKTLDEALTSEEYAIACPKGSELVDTINEVLQEMKDSGELDEIESKYISTDE